MTLLFVSCGSPNSSTEFQWQVDRFDDVNILRYRVNGFEQLSVEQKELLYYLSQASITGRDILFDQNFKYNLPLRRTLETIYTSYNGDKGAPEYAEFETYLKKIWFANGVHHHYSNDKFTPRFSAEYFDYLISSIAAQKLPSKEVLDTLKRVIFDPTFYPKRVSQEQGVDLVLNSAVNFYEGVTEAEVEALYASQVDPRDNTPISYGLNTKVVKKDGKVVEEVWRVGGLYSDAIEQTIYWLEKAAAVAENELQRETIEKLISHYRSGSLEEYDQYNVLWVKDNGGIVDFVNGFTKTYTDPLGRKATWESVINFKDIEATKRTKVISDNAQWFEDNSPIDSKYKKDEVKGVSAKVITVAMLGGDCYPSTPIGINLPNADWIRRDHGSKSVTIANITEAYANAASGNGFSQEFILDEVERERRVKYGTLAGDLHTDLHECLGHGSGQLAPGTKGDELKNYGSALEEARADLFALYYIADPKMIELGIVPNEEVAKAAYFNQILNGAMTQLTRIAPGKNIEQAHMRDRALIANWAIELGASESVIEKVIQDGKTYIRINDYDKLRNIFATQLHEIQRIKSEGDYEAGKALIETYGVKVDQDLHKEVLSRYAELNIAPYSGFVNPVYEVVEQDGKIVDIKLHYNQGYIEQMLEYSSKYSFL